MKDKYQFAVIYRKLIKQSNNAMILKTFQKIIPYHFAIEQIDIADVSVLNFDKDEKVLPKSVEK